MSVISNVTRTAGTILSAIDALANASARTVNTAASGLDMLDTFVQDAKTRQVIDSTFDMVEYAENAMLRSQVDAAATRANLNLRLEQDSRLKAEFDNQAARYAEISKALRTKLGMPALPEVTKTVTAPVAEPNQS